MGYGEDASFKAIPYLLIEYIENGVLEKINFDYSKEAEVQVNKIIGAFITNKQIKNVNISDKFFDIRSEELTKYIDEKK